MTEAKKKGNSNPSVTGGYSRNSEGNIPGKDSVVGPEVNPVRAGSIGWDTPAHPALNELPPKKAGGVSLRPLHGEISASWFPADWIGLQAMGALSIYGEPSFFRLWSPTRD